MKLPKWVTLSRLWDALAIAVILFVAWKWFVAPRSLAQTAAYPAPRVSYALLDGGNYALASRRGRVVFLDFWASWCDPCKAQLPLVERFARAHPEVDVVAVDVGEPRGVVASYAAAHALRGVALDTAGLSRGFFQIEGFPTMVVIDPQGKIRATWTGFNPVIADNMSNAQRVLR